MALVVAVVALLGFGFSFFFFLLAALSAELQGRAEFIEKYTTLLGQLNSELR